jgi:hypothetical protein
MNHKLIHMLGEAGFEFTPDIMAKLPEFEKLIDLYQLDDRVIKSVNFQCQVSAFDAAIKAEREQCAKACIDNGWNYAAAIIRARGAA